MNALLRSGRFVFLLVLSSILAASADATVHLMQIKRVIGGVHGDTTAQAIMLRMRSAFQDQTQSARLVAWDAAGANAVVLAAPVSAVANSALGDRVLYCTPSFESLTTPAAVPDFTMVPIPDSYLVAGSLTFETTLGAVYWRVSWGGAGYTGSHSGEIFNDADGNFGPAYAGPLPSGSTVALNFSGGATASSVSNATDYSLTAEQPDFTNNAGLTYVLDATATAAPGAPRLAAASVLHPVYPNPFNPRTNISLDLSRSGSVDLAVYTLSGRRVRELFRGYQPAGHLQMTWNGVDDLGRGVASGVYLLRLEAVDEVRTRKLVVSK
jgi:hypothetical protein